jgi:hypothetical protein
MAMHRTGTRVTIRWENEHLLIQNENGQALPDDVKLNPGDLLDALTVLAAQRHLDRPAEERHRTHAYGEYVGPGTTMGAFRDQLTGEFDREGEGE